MNLSGYRSEPSFLTRSLKVEGRNTKKKFCGSTLHGLIRNVPHKVWQYMKTKMNTQVSPDGIDQVRADDFNAYFRSFYTTDNGSAEIRPSLYNRDIRLIDTHTLSGAGILWFLLGIYEKKSSGPDVIPNSFLK